MRLLIINPGATSTKIAVYENENEVFRESMQHAPADFANCERIVDQLETRLALVKDALSRQGYRMADFAAVCARGGLLRHIPSGTYLVNDAVLEDIYHPPYGEHASSLGPLIAHALSGEAGIPAFFVDPVSVDEMGPLARVSGLAGMERESFFHALNHKAVARRAAGQLNRPYEELNLIVVHMGGGVSVAAHEKGRVVDLFNVKDDGSFAMDRGGALPTGALVNLCFSGRDKREIKKLLGTEAGVYSYLGTHDFREVERRAFDGDEKAKLIYEALAYQHAKDIGALAAVLRYDVDAIVYTGGIAYSERFCERITSYVGRVAPILRIPGEEEMRALALGALAALREGTRKEYPA